MNSSITAGDTNQYTKRRVLDTRITIPVGTTKPLQRLGEFSPG
ncbi:hypothetical protein [Paraburkholderia solitsugae]|nr:hypothetical protein [Paraburkholderia solitsugae]